jgi:hypothetical protein
MKGGKKSKMGEENLFNEAFDKLNKSNEEKYSTFDSIEKVKAKLQELKKIHSTLKDSNKIKRNEDLQEIYKKKIERLSNTIFIQKQK